MKLWFFAGVMFSNADHYGVFFVHALLRRGRFGFCISGAYYARCKPWVFIKVFSCQWGLSVFFVSLPSYWEEFVLWGVFESSGLAGGCRNTTFDNGDGFFGLCATLRSNVFLRGDSYYKFIVRSSLCGGRCCAMSLGGV